MRIRRRVIAGPLLLCAVIQFAAVKSSAAATREETQLLQKQDIRADERKRAAIAETQRIVDEIVSSSFPDLKNASIQIKTFESPADYFRSRFSFSRFLSFRKPHFLILVNPNVFNLRAPAAGIRAIIAHELAHIAYYLRRNRFRLFGLVALQSKSFTVRFERGADLHAIKRGYGAGLKEYREWLYVNIPADKIAAKKRDYFSPAEIDLILDGLKHKPDLINVWLKKVPRNAAEIGRHRLIY